MRSKWLDAALSVAPRAGLLLVVQLVATAAAAAGLLSAGCAAELHAVVGKLFG